MKVGRNDSCPCGSGKKYKHCCLRNEEPAPKVRPTPDVEAEPQFTCELRPDLDDKVDRILERVELGQRDGIEAELTALLTRNPRYHVTHYAMGVFRLVLNDDAGAIPFFERAVEIFPYFVEAHFNLGCSASRIGDIKKAALAYRKVLRYCDGDSDIAPKAREQLAWMQKLVTTETSFKSLDAMIENQTLFDNAFEALSKKKFQLAIDGFKKVLEDNPEHPQSYGNLGLAYAGVGRKADALECLDKALAIDPEYEPARINRIGIEMMEEGKPRDAKIGETRYYLEKHRSEKEDRRRSWLEKLKIWG